MTGLKQWLSERAPLEWIHETLLRKTVPRHRHMFWYLFGGLSLFLLVVQVMSGILLTLYYQPTPEHAHESVSQIVNSVPHGWLVRSVHAWSANLLIGTILVHMFSAYLLKAYRKPRELVWVTGVGLLFIILGFGFTGCLLPWDTRAYFATLIGTEVPGSIPLIGSWVVGLLKGSSDIGEATLTRMYSLHVVILPLSALIFCSLHLLLDQYSGASVPIETKTVGRPMRFFPDFFYLDLLAWLVGLLAVIALATMLPWGIGEKADPMASAPIGIRPEWFFLPLYQTLRMVPARFLGLDGEMVVNIIVGLMGAFWTSIPFLDRRAAREARSPIFTLIGICLVGYLMLTIFLAYLL
jgi:cytochrome b6